MKITAKATFIHGPTVFKRGSTTEVSETVGRALINARLVRETGAAKPAEPQRSTAEKPAAKPAAKPASRPAAKTAADKE